MNVQDRDHDQPETTVEPATSADAPEIARIWYEGWGDGHLGHVPVELHAHRTEKSFVARAEQRIPHTLVARVDGRVVGFAVLDGAEVEQVYVDRPARGTGVATDLLRAAETEVARAGHPVAWLAVVPGNARARRFYQRLGWVDRGAITYSAETATGAIDIPVHRYERDLGGRATD